MTSATKPLDDALNGLERALETPAIPGELPEWCAVAQRACAEARTEWERTVRNNHAPLLAEIFEFDPEQANRVDQLKQSDDELLERVDRLDERLKKLCEAAARIEPDEVRVVDRVEQVVDDGLALVIAIRRQEVSLSTWHSEALKRDRGVVD